MSKLANKIKKNGGQHEKPRIKPIQSECLYDQRIGGVINGLQRSLTLWQQHRQELYNTI
jgi:hypothetical protein